MNNEQSKARFVILWNEPVDREAFERHYREVHIPLTKKLPNLRRYTLSHNPRLVRGEGHYYVVSQLEWDTMAELQHAFASPEGQETAKDVADLVRLSTGITSMICELEDV